MTVMRKRLAMAALLALSGAARAEAPSRADPPGSVAQSQKPGPGKKTNGGGKEKRQDKQGDAAGESPAKTKQKPLEPVGEKPCEPVKPCPID